MDEIEKLLIEIDVLKSLDYVTAYTGSLDKLTMHSYVLFGDVIHEINKRRVKLKELGYKQNGKVRKKETKTSGTD